MASGVEAKMSRLLLKAYELQRRSDEMCRMAIEIGIRLQVCSRALP